MVRVRGEGEGCDYFLRSCSVGILVSHWAHSHTNLLCDCLLSPPQHPLTALLCHQVLPWPGLPSGPPQGGGRRA